MKSVFQNTIKLAVLALGLVRCGPLDSVTVEVPIDVDTYIDNEDSGNHGKETRLLVGSSGGREQKILLRYPTAVSEDELEDRWDTLSDCNPKSAGCFLAAVALFPLTFLEALFDAVDEAITPDDLTSATITLYTENDSEAASVASLLRLSEVTSPWYPDANWNYAHRLTSSGRWDSAGGDSQTSLINATGANPSANVITFDVTNHIKEMIEPAEGQYFFGYMISLASAHATVRLYSSNDDGSSGPKVTTVYTSLTGQKKTVTRSFADAQSWARAR